MFSLWKSIPDNTKQKIVDEVLERAARSFDRGGSKVLADKLRSWRSQTPFIEDVVRALGEATKEFESAHSEVGELGRWFGPSSPAWQDEVILRDLVRQLLLPRAQGIHVDESVVHCFQLEAARTLTAEQVTITYSEIIVNVRNILFAHPLLREVNSLLLKYAEVAAATPARSDRQNPLELPSAAGQHITSLGPGSGTSWERPPTVYLVRGSRRTLESADILTPRLAGTPAVGVILEKSEPAEVAHKLEHISAAIIESIASGRFAEQLSLADKLREIGESRFEEEYLYLKAEGVRISADFEPVSDIARSLRKQAGDLYLGALEVSPDSTRSVRGYGRVLEVMGESGVALEWYRRARARALDDQAMSDSASPDAIHEVLRSTRHYAACLGGIILADPASRLASEDGKVELRGITAESERLHRELLPKFQAPGNWLLIEWFMGSVLISRGYAAAGDSHRAHAALVRALDARVQMLAGSTQVDPVFLGNIRWWCGGARYLRGWSPVFDRQVDEIGAAVESADDIELWAKIGEILKFGDRPWSIGTGRIA